MKIFLCFCFFCFSLSAFAQQSQPIDTSTNSSIVDSLAIRDSVTAKKRDSALTARRDSIVNSVGKGLGVSKSKVETVLTAFSQAADSMNEIANNDDLTFDEKSTQLKAIAEQRDATLKSLLTEAQLEKVKTYLLRRKIPRKMR